MGFSRQEYWTGLPFPAPGYLPNPEIGPMSPALQVDSLLLSHQGRPRVNCKVLKLSEENMEEYLYDFRVEKDFSNKMQNMLYRKTSE